MLTHHVRKCASSDREAETAVSASVVSDMPEDAAEELLAAAAAAGSPLMMYWYSAADDAKGASASTANIVIVSRFMVFALLVLTPLL